METELSERVAKIRRELEAMKSVQNMGAGSIKTLSAACSYSGVDNSPAMDWAVITFKGRFTFTPSVAVDFVPFATLAYRARYTYNQHPETFSDTVGFYPARIESATPTAISWIIESCADPQYEWVEAGTQARTVSLQAQVYSAISGTLTFTRII